MVDSVFGVDLPQCRVLVTAKFEQGLVTILSKLMVAFGRFVRLVLKSLSSLSYNGFRFGTFGFEGLQSRSNGGWPLTDDLFGCSAPFRWP